MLAANNRFTLQATFTDDEISKMVEESISSQQKKPAYMPAYALEFQILTACRRAEIPPLRWEDVDFDKGIIHFHQQLLSPDKKIKSETIVPHTKTWMNREYPIATKERVFLRKLQLVHNKYYPDSPFLFPADTRLGCLSLNMVYSFFRRVCSKHNITLTKEFIKGPHAFRRNDK